MFASLERLPSKALGTRVHPWRFGSYAQGISHKLDLWGHDVTHEWTWWSRQARHDPDRRLAPDAAEGVRVTG